MATPKAAGEGQKHAEGDRGARVFGICGPPAE
eukprot:CAMPEP_0114679150 /NCGR_PEP_ID=MMETSP0191-20121206/52591_1 /TAXON_ID=126664 /ORGANISM="Sorites sp." /LENGTH=31 /DNA_ID= /DNA_START= /DNA_END= /DNA_ORIENTATION=